MKRVGVREARRRLARLEGWRMSGKKLVKTYRFKRYLECVRFFNRVARLAERVGHHPDALVSYDRLVLRLTTHDAGGLTPRDFRMAHMINRLEKRYVPKAEG